MADLAILIQNGKVVDGSGNPWFYGDIGVKDGKIKVIGKNLEKSAERVIEAKNKIVAPGFIDIHSHVDGMALIHPDMEGYLFQGITTTTFGNCGTSPFPDKETYVETMLSVSPFGTGVFYGNEVDKLPVNWQSLSDYAQIIRDKGVAMNIIPFIGHITVGWKVGLREARTATVEELGKICDLVRKGMDDGAFGLSIGLSYPPNSSADLNEFIKPLQIVADYNGILAVHLRNFATLEGIEEIIKIGRRVGIPIHIAHLNPPPTRFGEISEMLGVIDTARTLGVDLTFSVTQSPEYPLSTEVWRQYCYFILKFPLLSRKVQISQKAIESYKEFEQNLKNPKFREEITQIVMRHIGEIADYNKEYLAKVGDVYLINTGNDQLENKTIGELAEEKKVKPIQLFFDIIFGMSGLFDDNNPILVSQFFGKDEEIINASNHPVGMPCIDVYPKLTNESSIMAAPFPQGYSAFPTYFRNTINSGYSIEQAVRKMTSFPAQVLGLRDRGQIKVGYKADVVIFDSDKYMPLADCYNPIRKASGICSVLVNGSIVLQGDGLTGLRSGEVILKTK